MHLTKIRLRITMFIMGLILNAQINGQSNYIPKIIPPSPNQSTLLKFIDVPVSPYTGTSDVTVPIYTIQLKGVTVPINLNYHTGGIRLKEESGWVGLGWALSAGGSISRTILGGDDFDGQKYFTTFLTQLAGDLTSPQPTQSSGVPDYGLYVFDFWCSYQVAVSGGIMDYNNAFADGSESFDLEPDIFNYNIPGHSGKFMITRTGKVILQKQENIIVQFEPNGNSFTITDDQGNKFYFVEKEYTQPATGGHVAISSWNLTKIITQQQDSLSITYGSDNTSTYVAPDYNETWTAFCSATQGLTISNSAGTFYTNKYLQTIDFPGGQLQFAFDSLRSDLRSGKKLKNIKLYSRVASALTYVKEHDLFYSYYDGPATTIDSLEKKRLRLDSIKEVSGTLSIAPYVFSYNLPGANASTLKHGYNIDHWGYFNNALNNTFIPTQSIYYSPINQPYSPSQYITYTGANREADNSSNASNSSVFSLQQIKYPTGGKTVLAYEPNDYDYQKSSISPVDFPQVALVNMQPQIQINNYGTTVRTIDFSHITPMIAVGQPGTNLSMDITFRGSNLSTLHSTAPYGKMYVQITGPSYSQIVDITTQGLTCTQVCTIHYDMAIQPAPSEVYTITGFVDSAALPPGSFAQIIVGFQYNETQIVANGNNPTLAAGGLRIKSITDYNADNVVAKKRRYEYNYGYDGNGDGILETYSYGKLMAHPSYVRYSKIVNPSFADGDICDQLTIFGSSVTSLTSVSQGNSVGYSQVTEYTEDPSSGQNIGKTVYTYLNSPDSSVTYHGYGFPGMMNMGNNLNGSLLTKTDFANAGSYFRKVSATINDYHTTNRSVYFSPKYQYTTRFSSPNACTVGPAYLKEVIACFYPSFKSERVLTDSVTSYIYDQNDTTKWIKTVQKNYYDNTAHYQLTRSITTDSKNNQHVSFLKYPQDYLVGANTWTGNTIIDSLIGRNMVTSVIEKRDSLYYNGSTTGGKISSATVSRYKTLGSNSIGLDKQFKLDLPGPISNLQAFSFTGNTLSQDSRYRQVISFDSYDPSNNIQQFTPIDQSPNSFVWDYGGSYPIAQVKNATTADIAFTSFEADGKGGWTFTSTIRDTVNFLTGKKSYNLSQGAISKSGLTTGKVYVISFWSKSATFSITGGTVTTTTGRTSGSWTYKENAVTATATTLSISGSGDIDELRLYPKGSLMTSYTYQPLTGATTENDPNSEIIFYEYDSLQRLRNVKDYLGNIVKNIQYNYAKGCTTCSISMKTYSGSPTISYPVGVFSVGNKLLGNAKNQFQYDSLWNIDPANHLIGTLTPGSDSMHFILTLNSGQSSPGFVLGLRFFQYDLPYTQIEGVRNINGVYVDYGDNSGMFLGKSDADSNVLRASNTIFFRFISWNGYPFYYWIHTYPDNTNKTLTFYHNDGGESMTLDNSANPGTSLTQLRYLRGNFPQNMTALTFDTYQQLGASTVAGITNWSKINGITWFEMHTGDNMNPCMNISLTQDFLANNKNLQAIVTNSQGYYREGYEDTTFKISKLKSNWNTYFINLKRLAISDDHWNREDLTSLVNLNAVSITAGNLHHSYNSTNNPLVPIPTNVIDNIINQIAAGAGKKVTNGTLAIWGGGGVRSTGSDSGFNTLKAMGWTIYLDGVPF